MEETRNAYKILTGNPQMKKPTRKNIKMDFRETNSNDTTRLNWPSIEANSGLLWVL
jgi:hypothetical protein